MRDMLDVLEAVSARIPVEPDGDSREYLMLRLGWWLACASERSLDEVGAMFARGAAAGFLIRLGLEDLEPELRP